MTEPARSRNAVAPVALVVLVAAVALGVAWAGRVSEGRHALADGAAALSSADSAEAVLSFRIAAEARCPGCSAPEEGFASRGYSATPGACIRDYARTFAAHGARSDGASR